LQKLNYDLIGHLKIKKNAALAKTIQFDWFALFFPLSLQEKVELDFFSRPNKTFHLSNCACPRARCIEVSVL